MWRISTATILHCASATQSTRSCVGTVAAENRGRWPESRRQSLVIPTEDGEEPVHEQCDILEPSLYERKPPIEIETQFAPAFD
jgi:hypothetical protein